MAIEDYRQQNPQNQQYRQGQQMQGQQYSQPRHAQQPQYYAQQGSVPYFQQRMNPEVTTGQWVLNLFLVAIPIIGFILLLVWAFGSSAPISKKNWARANLIWILIAIIISIICTVVAMALGISFEQVIYTIRRQ